MKYFAVMLSLLMMFICTGCSKRTYAEVKAQLDTCISTKMVEFKMTGSSAADLKAFESIVDFCKVETLK
jgi:hypothetical protein